MVATKTAVTSSFKCLHIRYCRMECKHELLSSEVRGKQDHDYTITQMNISSLIP